jgi:hypothetical protein
MAALYGLMLAGVAGGMFSLRRAALATYGTPQAQAEWEAWRRAAGEMAQAPGPVRRRPPASAEPPALVLMRDHFGVCLAGALLLASVLFGTLLWLAHGALGAGSFRGPWESGKP